MQVNLARPVLVKLHREETIAAQTETGGRSSISEAKGCIAGNPTGARRQHQFYVKHVPTGVLILRYRAGAPPFERRNLHRQNTALGSLNPLQFTWTKNFGLIIVLSPFYPHISLEYAIANSTDHLRFRWQRMTAPWRPS